MRMGMSEEEARRRARLDFGGDDQLKESCRDARGTRWVDDIGQDLRFAARLLLKDRWFTLPAVIALALGIGMNGTMFTIVNAMIRGLPIDSPERIMSINARDGAGRWRGFGVSYLDFLDFQRRHEDVLRPCGVQPDRRRLSATTGARPSARRRLTSQRTHFSCSAKSRCSAAISSPRMISLAHQRSSSWAAAFGPRGTTQTRPSIGRTYASQRCALHRHRRHAGRFPVPGRQRRVATARAPAGTHRTRRETRVGFRCSAGSLIGARRRRRKPKSSPLLLASRANTRPRTGIPGRLSHRFLAISLPSPILIALMIAVGFVLLRGVHQCRQSAAGALGGPIA